MYSFHLVIGVQPPSVQCTQNKIKFYVKFTPGAGVMDPGPIKSHTFGDYHTKGSDYSRQEKIATFS